MFPTFSFIYDKSTGMHSWPLLNYEALMHQHVSPCLELYRCLY